MHRDDFEESHRPHYDDRGCYHCGALDHFAGGCPELCKVCEARPYRDCYPEHSLVPCRANSNDVILSHTDFLKALRAVNEEQRPRIPIVKAYPGYEAIDPLMFHRDHTRLIELTTELNGLAYQHRFSQWSVQVRQIAEDIVFKQSGADENDDIPLFEEEREEPEAPIEEGDGEAEVWSTEKRERIELRFTNHHYIVMAHPNTSAQKPPSQERLERIRREAHQSDNAFEFLQVALAQQLMQGTSATEGATQFTAQTGTLKCSGVVHDILFSINGVQLLQYADVPHEFIVIDIVANESVTIQFCHRVSDEKFDRSLLDRNDPGKWIDLKGGLELQSFIPVHFIQRAVDMMENYFLTSGMIKNDERLRIMMEGRSLVNQAPAQLSQVLAGRRQAPLPDYAYGGTHDADTVSETVEIRDSMMMPRQYMPICERTPGRWPFTSAKDEKAMLERFVGLLIGSGVIQELDEGQYRALHLMTSTGVHGVNGIAGGGKTSVISIAVMFHALYRGTVYALARTNYAASELLNKVVRLLWRMDRMEATGGSVLDAAESIAHEFHTASVFDRRPADNKLRFPYSMILRRFLRGYARRIAKMSLPYLNDLSLEAIDFANCDRIYQADDIRVVVMTVAHAPTPRKFRPSAVFIDEGSSLPFLEIFPLFGNIVSEEKCNPSEVHSLTVTGDPLQIRSSVVQVLSAYRVKPFAAERGGRTQKQQQVDQQVVINLLEKQSLLCSHNAQILISALLDEDSSVQLTVIRRFNEVLGGPVVETFYAAMSDQIAFEPSTTVHEPWRALIRPQEFGATSEIFTNNCSIVIDIPIHLFNPTIAGETIEITGKLDRELLRQSNQRAKGYTLNVQQLRNSTSANLFPVCPQAVNEIPLNVNSYEAASILQICVLLRESGANMNDVAIISPFTRQTLHLQRIIHTEFPRGNRPTVCTVGMAQSREWGWCLISFCVMDWSRSYRLIDDDPFLFEKNPEWDLHEGDIEMQRIVGKFVKKLNCPRGLVGSTRAKYGQLLFFSNAEQLLADRPNNDYKTLAKLVMAHQSRGALLTQNVEDDAIMKPGMG